MVVPPSCLKIDDHLVKAHKLICTQVQFRIAMKQALQYTDLGELEPLLRSPAPSAPASPAQQPTILSSPTATAPLPPPKRIIDPVKAIDPVMTKEPKPSTSNSLHYIALSTSAAGQPDSEDEESEEREEEEEPESSDYSSAESSEEEEEEEEEEEFEVNLKQEYYSQTRYEHIRHNWLCGYYKYLERPVSSRKSDRQLLQHVSQVAHLLEFLDPSGQDILALGEDEGDEPYLH